MGMSQISAVKKDSGRLCKTYNGLDQLSSLDMDQWLSERNPVVVDFIKGISGHSSQTKIIYAIAKAVEQTYNTQSTKNVFPLSFSENLVAHSVVNSKLNANINGLSAPAGSYWTIKRWLENQASDPLPPPVGDCLIAFDNDQVIGKTYHVRANQKVKSSVITSVCVAEVDVTGGLQKEENLKPSVWHSNIFNASDILDYNSDHNKKLSDIHYRELYQSLQHHIDQVIQQNTITDGTCSDVIDGIVARKQFPRAWKVCSACSAENPKSKRICIGCRAPLKSKEVEEPQLDVAPPVACSSKERIQEFTFSDDQPAPESDSDVAPTSIHVTCRDPVFVNPNSFDTVKEVLIAIGKDFRIKKYCSDGEEVDREWLLVICDGLPYTLGQRVVRETFRCETCTQPFFGKDVFIEHCESSHQMEEKDILFTLEFDWVDLRIGFGHYGMNMIRSFVEMNWEVMVKDLAFAMGFRSEAAQKYAKKGSDHHKGWELLNILYEGSLQELLLPYVRSGILANPPVAPTPDGYLNWTETVQNPKYKYLQEQILTCAQSIINFRKGVRYNDKDLIMCGKFKHAPIFHGRNHPRYQHIELNESRNDIIMPPRVKEFVHNNQSVSRSGQPGRGEDMDFQLENLNKRSKVWTPKGVPSQADWMRTFRNLEKLEEMRLDTLKRMGCDDPKGVVAASSSHDAQPNEIREWRAKLRESGFLANPQDEDLMTSVSGQPLDGQLVMFTCNAWSRRRCNFQVMFEGASNEHVPDSIFVLPEEREMYHDIKNQTKAYIANKISQLMAQLDDDVKPDFLYMWQSIQKKKKEDYLNFYEQVTEQLAETAECAEYPALPENDDE